MPPKFAIGNSSRGVQTQSGCRSSTHGVSGELSKERSAHDVAIAVIPEEGVAQHDEQAHAVPAGTQTLPVTTLYARHKKRRHVTSILSSIQRHYGTVVDVASYVGLGLVLYAGTYLRYLPELNSACQIITGMGFSAFVGTVCLWCARPHDQCHTTITICSLRLLG